MDLSSACSDPYAILRESLRQLLMVSPSTEMEVEGLYWPRRRLAPLLGSWPPRQTAIAAVCISGGGQQRNLEESNCVPAPADRCRCPPHRCRQAWHHRWEGTGGDPQRSKSYSCGRDTARHDTALCTQPCQPKPGRKVCHRICTHDLRSCGRTYRKPQNILNA